MSIQANERDNNCCPGKFRFSSLAGYQPNRGEFLPFLPQPAPFSQAWNPHWALMAFAAWACWLGNKPGTSPVECDNLYSH